MDSVLGGTGCDLRRGISFNSIEWIRWLLGRAPDPWFQALSIPLNGFLYQASMVDVSLLCLSIPLNGFIPS